ncbi:MAG: DUF523 domain-containing protein [Candidatus Wallbacteria bacterium]|nr:DUF523 domain-containing protein [Candidatus Wallbacteria bacterium]
MNGPVLVSACLLGIPCRFDGMGKPHPGVVELAREKVLIPVCPEQLGGLPTPRLRTVFCGNLLRDESGCDVTSFFERGAAATLEIARLSGATCAIMKEKSPSCGVEWVYSMRNGRETLVPGMGITTELLKKNGITVYSENLLAGI